MADSIVERLFIYVGLNTKAVDKGLTQLSSKLDGGLKKIIKSVAAPAMTAFAGVMSGQFVSDMIAGAKQAAKFGSFLGMSTEEMSAWADTAQSMGIQLEDLVNAFSKVGASASNSLKTGTGSFAELVQNGVIDSLTDADGKLKSTEELVLELSDVLKNMNPGEATALARSVGIRNVGQIAMLRRGRTELERTVASMKKQGAYTDEDAKKSKEFSKSLMAVSRAIRNLLLPVFRLILPLMSNAAKGFAFLSKHIRAFYPLLSALAVAAIISLRNVAKAAAVSFAAMVKTNPVMAALLALALLIGLLYDDYKAFQKGAENSAFPGFWKSVTEVKDGIAVLKEEYVKFGKVALGAATMLYASVKLYKMGVWILNSAFGKLIARVIQLGVSALIAIGPIGWAIMAVVAVCAILYAYWDELSAFMQSAWETLCTAISAWWNSVCQGVTDWWNSTCDSITGAWDSATSSITSIWNSIISTLTSAWDGFVSTLETAFSWIASKFTWLTNGLGKLKGLLPSLSSGIQMLNSTNGNSYNSTSESSQTNNFYVQGSMDRDTADSISAQINTNSQNFG